MIYSLDMYFNTLNPIIRINSWKVLTCESQASDADEVDEDGSGTIDFDEFTQMMSKQLAAEALEQIPERPEKECQR